MKYQPSISKKRKCAYPGCRTILTCYNLSNACLAHQIPFFDLITDKIENLTSALYHFKTAKKSKDKNRMNRIKAKIRRLEKILDK